MTRQGASEALLAIPQKIWSRSYNHSLSFNHVNGKFVTMKLFFKAMQFVVGLDTQLTQCFWTNKKMCRHLYRLRTKVEQDRNLVVHQS